MLLPLHIVIALLGLIVAIVGYFFPTRAKLLVSYALTTFTVVSGTLLIVLMHASILHTCMTGLFYLSIVTIATSMARRKILATEKI